LCHHGLEAAFVERRLIRELAPRYNRQGRRPAATFLKFTLAEPFPRLSVVRSVADDGALYLGPLPSPRLAKLAAEAIESVIPIRRCTSRLRLARSRPDGDGQARQARALRVAPCAPAQLGVSTCPCAGGITVDDYRSLVDLTVEALTDRPELVLGPLRSRIDGLARAERYEQAADVRDRAEALTIALRRQRRLRQLEASGRVTLEVPGGGVVLESGTLTRAWGSATRRDTPPAELSFDLVDASPRRPADMVDEVLLVGAWLDANAHRVRLVDVSGTLASPIRALPSFAAGARVRP
jgi:DNA polymerase-3 subunit epsilon